MKSSPSIRFRALPFFVTASMLATVATATLHAQWISQKSGTNTDLADVLALNEKTAIAVGRDGSILRTTDAGETWVIQDLPPLFFHPWNAVSFSSASSGAIAGDFGRVITTTDGGEQWRWHSVGRRCLSVLQIEPATIYVGDDSGWVHHSLDSGNTWSSEHISRWPIRALFPWTGAYIEGLPIYAVTPYSLCSKTEFPSSPWNEKILQAFQGLGSEAFSGEFCGGGGAGFIVGVGGDFRAAPLIVRKLVSDTAWVPVATGPSADGTLFGVSAPSTHAIYACGDQGMIFGTTDGGDTWSLAPVPTTRRLRAISFSDEMHGFAVGDSGTILFTSNGGATAVENNTLLPHGPALYQNYPNPFNATTNIQLTIVKRLLTIVDVYDVLGRQVSTLLNEVKEPGTYSVQFDGSSFASGVYFYTLRALPAGGPQRDGFVQTKRLMLLK